MLGFDFGEQINGRISIDGVIKPGRGRQGFDVDRTINIQALTAAVGFELFFLPLLNPAVRRNAVMLRVRRVGEI